jgi:hypothetical protein
MINKISFLLAMSGMVFLFQSCKKEGCTDPNSKNYNEKAEIDNGTCISASYLVIETTISGDVYQKVVGTIDEDFTFSNAKKWVLSGGVYIDNGATLTIEAGTEIYAANDGTVPFLAIQRGAKINAVGTASQPIVLSTIKKVTSTPAVGDWGGLIINGKATINSGAEASGEGGTGLFGGNDDNDNSGIIKYVRVEYAGRLLSTDNELNAFSFNGVGSGTVVEYIQAYKGADDGIEFFGGTVSVKYAVSTGIKDDCFDWALGWRGNGQFWVGFQEIAGGDRGIEGDNNGDNNVLAPYSNPTLSNITLVGVDDGDAENTGMRLREGTKGKIYNAIVTGFPNNGIRVSDSTTNVNMLNNELTLKSSIVYANGTDWKDCGSFTPINETTNSDVNPGVLTGYLGTTTTNAFDPTTLGVWFTSATFLGAVESSNDWTAGWTVQ